MKFDKLDNPQVRTTGVEVGPSSQLPVSHVSGAQPIVEGLNDIGQAAATFQNERRKSNLFRARQSELKFAEEANQIEIEFRNQKGDAALDTASTRDAIETVRQKYAGDLQSDEARADYDLRTRLRMLAMVDGVEKHAADQRVKIYGAVADRALSDMKDSAVKDYNNPAKIEQALQLGLSTMMEYLSGHLGLPDAQVDQALEQAQRQVYGKVLKAYIGNRQFIAGREYFNQIKEHMGSEAEEWSAAFNKAADDAEVEAMATEAWTRIQAEATDSVFGRFNPELAREALTQLYSPEVRARIEKDINTEIATAKAAQAEEDNQRLARLSKEIRDTGRLDKRMMDYRSLDDVGQDKAEHDAEVAARIKANDNSQKSYQRMINRIGLNAFYDLPPEEQANLKDEEIPRLTAGLNEDGVVEIMKARQHARSLREKGGLVNKGAFTAAINANFAVIKDKVGNFEALKFREQAEAWYRSFPADKLPTKEQFDQFLGTNLLMLDSSFSDTPVFAANEAERKAWKLQDPNGQIFEAAQKLLARAPGATTLAEVEAILQAQAAAPAPKVKTVKNKVMTGADWIKTVPQMEGKLDPDTIYELTPNRTFVPKR